MIHHFITLGKKLTLADGSITVVKGFTKASVIAFVLLALSEIDVTREWSVLQPFVQFLDKAWLLPMNVTWPHFTHSSFSKFVPLHFCDYQR